jgi:hypothetical protein
MLVMPQRAAAQVKPLAAAQSEQSQTRPLKDEATQAMRREAEASMKERERMFAKIRRLELSGAQPVVGLDLQRLRANEAAEVALRAQRIRARMAVMEGGFVIRAQAVEAEPETSQDDQDEPEAAQNENRPALPLRQKVIVVSENFDQWLFSGDTIGERQARLNDNLRRTIERVDRAHLLTAVQRQKLEFAGRGDIKHLFDQVEVKRREFEEIQNDLQEWRAFVRTLRPLREAYVTGPFHEGSLFAKVLKTMRQQSQ